MARSSFKPGVVLFILLAAVSYVQASVGEPIIDTPSDPAAAVTSAVTGDGPTATAAAPDAAAAARDGAPAAAASAAAADAPPAEVRQTHGRTDGTVWRSHTLAACMQPQQWRCMAIPANPGSGVAVARIVKQGKPCRTKCNSHMYLGRPRITPRCAATITLTDQPTSAQPPTTSLRSRFKLHSSPPPLPAGSLRAPRRLRQALHRPGARCSFRPSSAENCQCLAWHNLAMCHPF